MPRIPRKVEIIDPHPHPMRGWMPPQSPPFELIKIAIADSLELIYQDPGHIWSRPQDVDEYDPETGEVTEYFQYENVVEGVEAYAAGTADMLQKTGTKPIVGPIGGIISGPVTGVLPPGFLKYQ